MKVKTKKGIKEVKFTRKQMENLETMIKMVGKENFAKKMGCTRQNVDNFLNMDYKSMDAVKIVNSLSSLKFEGSLKSLEGDYKKLITLSEG